MKPTDITSIIKKIAAVVENHKLENGSYKRFPEDDFPNPYGCADAANILYTIGLFPREREEREAFVRVLRSMQDTETGLFNEKPSDPTKFVHDPIHTTAHCMAALELFDVRPRYEMKGLDAYRTKEGLYALLDGLDLRTFNRLFSGVFLVISSKD